AQDAVALAREQKLSGGASGDALLFEATALQNLKRYEEAAATAGQAVTEFSRGYGELHPMVPIAMTYWGAALVDARKPAEARAAFGKSLELRQQLYGGGQPVAESEFGIGHALHAEGNLAAALDAFRRGTQILERDRFGEATLRFDSIAGYLDTILDAAKANP